MNSLCRNLRVVFRYGTVALLLLLSACVTPTPSASQLMLTPPQLGASCETCAQATLAVALTQQQSNADLQAEVVRANAQATLNSANGTLSAVETQQQNDANVVAAQIAAAAEIVRANAQATLNSAGSTQNAAFAADAIRQTQLADQATTGAQSVLNQQYQNGLAVGTQTAIANLIATQGQAAAVTSQSYVDQRHQLETQRRGPITFLWVWFLPTFILLLAGLILWGIWRRLTIEQDNQRILENPVNGLPAIIDVLPHHHGGSVSYPDRDRTEDGYQVTTPSDPVEHWLDEVKDELLGNDEKDPDDKTDG